MKCLRYTQWGKKASGSKQSVFKREVEGVDIVQKGFSGGSVVKNLPANAGDTGLIPGSGRSPEEGNSNPLQYSGLGNLTEEPCGLQSTGSQRVRHNLATKERRQYSRIYEHCTE